MAEATFREELDRDGRTVRVYPTGLRASRVEASPDDPMFGKLHAAFLTELDEPDDDAD
jgi:hypothetical protein